MPEFHPGARNPETAQAMVTAMEITTRSWLGAVVANSGGIVIDHGWLRVLGSGGAGLHAMLAGSMTGFYANLRWPGWEAEVANVRLDEDIHTWPPPWTAEGKNLATVSRRAIPLAELLAFHQDTARQLSGGQ